MTLRLESIDVRPLSVPLKDPFVIASGRVDVTCAALVTAVVVDERRGVRTVGFGEAATLTPVTAENQQDVLQAIGRFARLVPGSKLEAVVSTAELTALIDAIDPQLATLPVSRAGIEAALFDAVARSSGVPLFSLLCPDRARPAASRTLTSDITLPINPPPQMAKLAGEWRALGFTAFKVKVGIDRSQDLAALAAVHDRVPDATFRLDANGGYEATDAIEVFSTLQSRGLVVECFEQPCAREDLAGMALCTRELPIPVIADESVRSMSELLRVVEARAASGVNLKLSKMGGPYAAFAIGHRAKTLGLEIMVGGMVETRLGMTTAAHVAVALGDARFIDLDTAWLLAADPFRGGYVAKGPSLTLLDEPGQALEIA